MHGVHWMRAASSEPSSRVLLGCEYPGRTGTTWAMEMSGDQTLDVLEPIHLAEHQRQCCRIGAWLSLAWSVLLPARSRFL